MNKKQIGIISFYYQNYNYGGQLQAYALVRKLNELGYQAEQICFDRAGSVSPLKQYEGKKSHSLEHYFKAFQNRVSVKYQALKKDNSANTQIQQRNTAIQRFSDGIKHSETVYSSGNLPSEAYTAYICGSDQIWNPSYTRDAYFLNFPAKEKRKIAYAASIGRSVLNDAQLAYIMERVKKLDAVSVREQAAQELIQTQTGLHVSHVLDPTLLLDRTQWNEVCTDYPINGAYVLAYFLGDDVKQRKAAVQFARKKHCKLVTFPHILGKYREIDKNFGDIQIFEGPAEFISLIRNADYVITDSFHASVFSCIYDRPFIVFSRTVNSTEKNMNSRISSLLQLMDAPDRLTDPTAFIEKGSVIKPVNAPYFNETFEEKKRESIRFILTNLSSLEGDHGQ